jgi:hypothetical protein
MEFQNIKWNSKTCNGVIQNSWKCEMPFTSKFEVPSVKNGV